MQLYTYFTITIIAFLPIAVFAQKNDNRDFTTDEYINKFKNIAIQEMERSGIPASITLAQGIHESAYGNSNLAKKANNHFGIKCTKDWSGKKMHKWDDEARKSCFRVYTSPEDSYVDHTDFLLNRKHYAFLFKYERGDYKRWAKGLKKAGYATDPRYPEKLIHTIEKYKLAQYDKATGLLTYDTTRLNNLAINQTTNRRTKPRSFFFKSYKPGFFRTNGASYAISRKGESALVIAKRFGIPYKRFLKFNDLQDGDNLMDYQPMYIQPKRNTYKGEETFYKVEKDITMYEIAQEFGIKLANLLSQNLLEKGEEPQNGELIMLKETAISKPKLRPKTHVDTLPSPYVDEKDIKKVKTPVTAAKVVIPKIERPKPAKIEVNTPTYDNGIYSDTTRINTSKSKNKEFLDITVTGDNTFINRNSQGNGNNSGTTKVIRRPRTSTKSKVEEKTKTNSGANPDALFDPNKVTRKEDPRLKEDPKPIKDPVYKGNSRINSGSTKDYVLTNPRDKNSIPVKNNVTPPREESVKYHVVQKGDTLYSLFRKYNVKVQKIQEANNLTSTVLNVGTRLKIPVK